MQIVFSDFDISACILAFSGILSGEHKVKQEVKLYRNISKTPSPALKASCTACKKLEKIFLHSVEGTWYNIVRYYASAGSPLDRRKGMGAPIHFRL